MKPDRVFEVSWEVANKVGGINTVIKSKAALMCEHYSSYTMIGPYVEGKANIELEQQPVPHAYKNVFAKLQEQGIKCSYGRWRIAGEPETILINFDALKERTAELKQWYWEHYKIDSIFSKWDFDEPMLFATAAGMLIQEYQEEHNEKVVGHFHEWMTGFALLHLKAAGSSVATVFTTHATMLGRAIAGSNEPLYQMLDELNPEEKAKQVMVQDKFTAERASAQNADVFTTVSEITALEAEKILGRKPEVLLYNGLSNQKFPTVEETSIKHATSRERLREFIAYYFFPYYSFDVNHTLMFFITARYEYRNKGLDVMIEALRRLNEYLKEHKPDRKIVVFYWIPLATRGVKRSLIENKNAYFQIKNYVDWHGQSLLKQLTFDFLIYGTQDNNADFSKGFSNMFTQDFLQDLRKDLMNFKREGNPPISTHTIIDEDKNELHQNLLRAGLDNKEDDCVKSIMYPAYLDGSDSLLNLPYFEAIVGTHLGVFPSYYEPWGYTPLESAALAVPAITTDLAGFGRFVQQNTSMDKGIWVQPRFNKSWEEEVTALFELMKNYANYDHVERVENRLAAKSLAALADWKHFVKHYIRAHELALEAHKETHK